MSPVVEIANLSKWFDLHSEPNKTVKERFLTVGRSRKELFRALDDVSFDVSRGETIGLLGHNGSGKSTLLKCIAGTIRPSAGSVTVEGRIAAMLELGAGFHPDLTGRENVYLNSSILGFSRDHIDELFDEIVDFSELGEFIDTQVKYYSSGMYARLGFAVAVNLEPDVLLVDEVLAVGDEAFQRKCLQRVRVLQERGTTIVLVTHAPDQVLQLCSRAIVLDGGHLIFEGDPVRGVQAFRNSLTPGSAGPIAAEPAHEPDEEEPAEGDGSTLTITAAAIDPPPHADGFRPGDDVIVRLYYRATEPTPGVRARMRLTSHDGVQMLSVSSADIQGADYPLLKGRGEIAFTIRNLPLLDATYSVALALQDHLERFEFDRRDSAVTFTVFTGLPSTGRVAFDLKIDRREEEAEVTT